MARAIDVAQFIFTEYQAISGKIIDEMKLHKLLYLSQRESISITNEPMFEDYFEGWKYGPVCKVVRNSFSENGIVADDIQDLSNEDRFIVKNVILQYGAYESWKLSELSHKELSWKNARRGLSDTCNGNKRMKLEDIRKDAEKIRPYDSVWDMYYDEFDDVGEI
ncbi:type II toxin-antitoxin system antitoxin SocA domain-containing protein [Veillonella sp. AF13-2]|uniref:Panacea domain-containing protein n=1 Tax=Veillonella sp. AF13-2 TaxID=2293250 RepID=UPI000EED57E7|nr:type II toxin-antitoxin system antitoxin SocA domain-containing protein [Veillonella sp. AF13-2]RJV51161.1 DUF4065 domain-containing protein [Veillonella sp. AF13-2]